MEAGAASATRVYPAIAWIDDLRAPHLPCRQRNPLGEPQDDHESEENSWVQLLEIPELIGSGDISSGTTLVALLHVLALTRETLTPVTASLSGC